MARTPMIAMTIINSTSVKPRRVVYLCHFALSLLVAGLAEFAALREHSRCRVQRCISILSTTNFANLADNSKSPIVQTPLPN